MNSTELEKTQKISTEELNILLIQLKAPEPDPFYLPINIQFIDE